MPKTFGGPGPRFIYPDLVSSPSLARCGLVANTLWPRLIVRADDQGRMPGDAASILVSCFPKLLAHVSLADVESALAELRRARMILVYHANREVYLQISGWWRWQQGMRRAYLSRFPSPRGWIDIAYGIEGQPSSFGNALELGGFVLDSDGKVRAARPQSARTSPAVRGETPQFAANARAQGPDPIRSDPSNPDPSSSDPSIPDRARDVPPRRQANGRSRSSPPTTNGTAVEESIALANDTTKPASVRRAARRAVERHAPERLGEIQAGAA
jgi:hypothetical protein